MQDGQQWPWRASVSMNRVGQNWLGQLHRDYDLGSYRGVHFWPTLYIGYMLYETVSDTNGQSFLTDTCTDRPRNSTWNFHINQGPWSLYNRDCKFHTILKVTPFAYWLTPLLIAVRKCVNFQRYYWWHKVIKLIFQNLNCTFSVALSDRVRIRHKS